MREVCLHAFAREGFARHTGVVSLAFSATFRLLPLIIQSLMAIASSGPVVSKAIAAHPLVLYNGVTRRCTRSR
jgi:hypothetical protein